jgi:GT2 family glycosyltransferase
MRCNGHFDGNMDLPLLQPDPLIATSRLRLGIVDEMQDLITISIPTFRRPSTLLHCLHSCLIQDYRPLEIDISDNSPTDDTRALVESVLPPEGVTIRYWRNVPTIGPVENQKKLLASVRGRRFVWMNDDDALLPGSVSAMAASFSLASNVILSYGCEQVINSAGEVLPDHTNYWNVKYQRISEQTGLRHNLLICAFWQQVPHVGFLVLTEAARKVGVRGRAEVGLAIDVDFMIRLGQAYRGYAHVFIDRMVVQSRIAETTLSQTSLDVAWKFFDVLVNMADLSPEEAEARERLLRRIAPIAMREYAMARGRQAALRLMMSRRYPRGESAFRLAYTLGLIAMPKMIFTMRRMAGDTVDERGWISGGYLRR